jgi:hypothetical protein
VPVLLLHGPHSYHCSQFVEADDSQGEGRRFEIRFHLHLPAVERLVGSWGGILGKSSTRGRVPERSQKRYSIASLLCLPLTYVLVQEAKFGCEKTVTKTSNLTSSPFLT